MINIGYIEGTLDESFVVRIYYDQNVAPVGDTQPLINGPRGFCLDVTNTSGRNRRVTISGVSANPITGAVAQGDPVTTGAGRSRTVAALNAAGFTTRGDVGDFSIGPG